MYYILLFFLILNLITFMIYRYDKHNAEFNGPSKVLKKPRVSEKTLHILSSAGGWPAAFLAQQCLRHKTIKKPFQHVYKITVLINMIIIGILIIS